MEWISSELQPDHAHGEAVVRFPATERVFAGHFAHQAILPGVVLIDSAVAVCARVLDRPLRLAGVASAKFVHPVEPDQAVRFAFAVLADPATPGRIKISGQWFLESRKVADLLFTVIPAGA